MAGVPREPASHHRQRGQERVDADLAVAALSAAQFGPVHRHQLIECGLTERMIERALAGGGLQERYPSVYTTGHPHLRPEGRRMAALLYAGPEAFLAGLTSVTHMGLLPDARRIIDVCVPGRATVRSRDDVRIHERDRVRPGEIAHDGPIAQAGLPLALLDIAAGGKQHLVEKALDQAAIREILDMGPLDAIVTDRAGERGVGILRSVLADHRIGESVTKSELEALVLRILRKARFPAPLVNEHVRGATEWWEADLLWPSARFIIETDGLKYHRTPARRERDRQRDADLFAAGWRPIRVTWRMAKRTPEVIIRATHRGLSG